MRIASTGLTDTGKKRRKNEDSYFIDPDNNLFVVADGMGGHAAGEVASKIAVSTIGEFIQDAARLEDKAAGTDRPQLGRGENITAAIQSANDQILQAMEENLKHLGMGTTVVTAWLIERRAYIGHVGDSRAYLIRDGRIQQITVDHTLVNEQVRRGILTEDEARNHPSRNILTRAVGSHGQVMVDINEEELRAGDRLLLCSDGLYTMVDDPTILKAVDDNGGDTDGACQQLIQIANEHGGEDNITVILLQIDPPGSN